MEANLQDKASTLDSAVTRTFYGINMPVLSPVDLFLGQSLHTYAAGFDGCIMAHPVSSCGANGAFPMRAANPLSRKTAGDWG